MNNGLADGLAPLARRLDAISDPETGRGLYESGRIKGLAQDAKGRVSFTIEAPAAGVEAYRPVRDAAEAAIAGQKGVTGVIAVLTAHDAPPPRPGAVRVRKGDPAPAPPGRPVPKPTAAEGLPGVAKVIAVASAKGGVGKSTIAVNLACAMAALGLRVGLLDLDVYGPSVPTLLGLADAKPEIGQDGKLVPLTAHGVRTMSIGFIVDVDAPMIWRGPMATQAVRQMLDDVAWAPLDVLILDLPPGTGDVHLTLAQRLPLDGAVIVSTPQELALADVRRGIAMFERTHVPILGLIENMAWLEQPDGRRLFIFGEGGARRTALAASIPFLGEIPIDPALRESADQGRPLAAVNSDKPTATAIIDAASAIMTQLKRDAFATPLIRFTDE